jgi:hypothetical protein
MQSPTTKRASLRLGAKERIRLQNCSIALILAVMAFALYPYILSLRNTRDFQTCQTNVQKIAKAISMYAGMYDDTLPLAPTWMDAARGNMTSTTGSGFAVNRYFQCPIDRSGLPSSYAYNQLMEGLSLTTRPTDEQDMQRRRALGRIENAALVIERHGSPENASIPLPDWTAVLREMTRPHPVPIMTGSLIAGNLTASSKVEEKLKSLSVDSRGNPRRGF